MVKCVLFILFQGVLNRGSTVQIYMSCQLLQSLIFSLPPQLPNLSPSPSLRRHHPLSHLPKLPKLPPPPHHHSPPPLMLGFTSNCINLRSKCTAPLQTLIPHSTAVRKGTGLLKYSACSTRLHSPHTIPLFSVYTCSFV